MDLLKKPMEVLPFINLVSQEGDKNRDSLGFFPKSVYEDFSKKGNLWVIIDNGNYAGHVMFSVAWSKLKITVNQTYVLPKYRKLGFAKFLIEELKSWGKKHNITQVRANVADDLMAANVFYDKMGFKAICQKNGGNTKNRKINIRIVDLDNSTLLNFADKRSKINFVSNTPINQIYKYVVDLNILNDFVKNRKHKQNIELILQNSFRGGFQLYITQEALVEIERNNKLGSDDPLYNLIKALPTLKSCHGIEDSELFKNLEKLIFGTIDSSKRSSINKISDLKHIAYCIQNNCTGFITRDGDLLKMSPKIYKEYNLEINSPEEFVCNEDIYEDKKTVIDRGNDTCSIEHISENNDKQINLFFSQIKIDRNLMHLSKFNGIRITQNEEMIAFSAWSKIHKKKEDVIAYIFYDEEKCNLEIFDHIIESIFRVLKTGEIKTLTIFIPCNIPLLDKRLIDRGFSSSTDKSGLIKYTRLVSQNIISENNWSKFCEKVLTNTGKHIQNKLYSYKKLKTNGILIGENSEYYDFFNFETQFSPTIIVAPERDVAIIPIKPEYARELVGEEFDLQKNLIEFSKKPAFLKTEKAYFKNPKSGSKVAKGDLLMFYASTPIKAMIGIGRVTYSKVIEIEDVANTLASQGVINIEKLKKIAVDNKISVITFDNFFPFKNNVDILRLKKRELGKNSFVTVTKTTSDVFLSVCADGGIYVG